MRAIVETGRFIKEVIADDVHVPAGVKFSTRQVCLSRGIPRKQIRGAIAFDSGAALIRMSGTNILRTALKTANTATRMSLPFDSDQ
jgi:hypothetical protein